MPRAPGRIHPATPRVPDRSTLPRHRCRRLDEYILHARTRISVRDRLHRAVEAAALAGRPPRLRPPRRRRNCEPAPDSRHVIDVTFRNSSQETKELLAYLPELPPVDE